MKNFLFSFCMLLGAMANAQTYGCTFSNAEVIPSATNGNSKFRVVINMVSAGGTFNLGGTNFRYNMNQLALTNPVVVATAFPLISGFAATTTVGTNQTTGIQSINTVYNGTANMSPVVIGATPVPLVTMEYNIIETGPLVTDLVFRQTTAGNPRTVALDDDKVTTRAQTPALFATIVGFPLPIDLVSFSATEKGTSNEILWETAMEENVREFAVERSLNGVDWTTLGSVTPNDTKRYSMLDRNPAKTTYYRLRNIDADGQTDLSQMVVVNRKSKDSKGITFIASPNPVTDVVKITFDSAVKGSVTTNIMNVAGQIVHTQLSAVLAKDVEITTFDVNMNDLPAGTYFIKVNSDSDEFVKTIVKQ